MCDYKFRLVLLGDRCVGKTSFANKLCNNSFLNIYEPTVGVDYFSKTYIINNNFIKCQIWDTTGSIKFCPILKNYYKDIAGAIFVFDLNKINSFNSIKFWLNEVETTNIDYPYTKLLIGNITNDKKCISQKEINDFCLKNNFLYTEINIKKEKNFDFKLLEFLNNIFSNKENNKGVFKNQILNHEDNKDNIDDEEKTNCCCWGF